MKLYTEEQVRNMLDSIGTLTEGGVDYYTSEMTPIELPSDEEIFEYVKFMPSSLFHFQQGAKWVIEQIKQQDNGNT